MKKDYIVQYSGLSIGKHEFEFEINDAFIKEFEFQDVFGANVKVALTLEKSERMIIFNFAFSGILEVLCDRCADDLNLAISGSEQIIAKYGEVYEETDDVIILPHSDSEIDLSQMLYEMINLALPIRKVHDEGECNKDILNKMNEEEIEEDEDPRWEALKQLKNKEN